MRGRKMKVGTIKFRALTDFEVIRLMAQYQLKEIASIYDVNQSFISLELTKRNLFKPDKRRVSILPEEEKYYYNVGEEEREYVFNEWMFSKERKALKQLGIVNN